MAREKGSLGNPAGTTTSATRSLDKRMKMDGWMDGWIVAYKHAFVPTYCTQPMLYTNTTEVLDSDWPTVYLCPIGRNIEMYSCEVVPVKEALSPFQTNVQAHSTENEHSIYNGN